MMLLSYSLVGSLFCVLPVGFLFYFKLFLCSLLLKRYIFQRSLFTHMLHIIIIFSETNEYKKSANLVPKNEIRPKICNENWCEYFVRISYFISCFAQVNKLTQQNKLKIELNARHNWNPYIFYMGININTMHIM